METMVHNLYGKNDGNVPLLAPEGSPFPTMYIHEFETYCGAGQGIGDLIVPDTMWGLKVSAACWIHDYMWKICDATWADFHYSNSVFLHNILSIVQNESRAIILKYLRSYRAVTYYVAVDMGVGAKIFWCLKEAALIQERDKYKYE